MKPPGASQISWNAAFSIFAIWVRWAAVKQCIAAQRTNANYTLFAVWLLWLFLQQTIAQQNWLYCELCYPTS